MDFKSLSNALEIWFLCIWMFFGWLRSDTLECQVHFGFHEFDFFLWTCDLSTGCLIMYAFVSEDSVSVL
jgi:hypothetical protein